MRILFCNIAWMDNYKGIIPGVDEPKNGGSYVSATGNAHEAYDFQPVNIEVTDNDIPKGIYCLGFVETKSTNRSVQNELHIEKIAGCEMLKKEDSAEDVLVIYCAKYPFAEKNETYVVGWYQHATVYRYYECATFQLEDGGKEEQYYNAFAIAENCVCCHEINEESSLCGECQGSQKGVPMDLGSQMSGLLRIGHKIEH